MEAFWVFIALSFHWIGLANAKSYTIRGSSVPNQLPITHNNPFLAFEILQAKYDGIVKSVTYKMQYDGDLPFYVAFWQKLSKDTFQMRSKFYVTPPGTKGTHTYTLNKAKDFISVKAGDIAGVHAKKDRRFPHIEIYPPINTSNAENVYIASSFDGGWNSSTIQKGTFYGQCEVALDIEIECIPETTTYENNSTESELIFQHNSSTNHLQENIMIVIMNIFLLLYFLSYN